MKDMKGDTTEFTAQEVTPESECCHHWGNWYPGPGGTLYRYCARCVSYQVKHSPVRIVRRKRLLVAPTLPVNPHLHRVDWYGG